MIFDIEGDNLLYDITKLHCMAYTTPSGKVKVTTNMKKIAKMLKRATVLIGHNIITFDIPAVEKVLGIKIKARLIDTLALSWYINYKRQIHGLDSFGKEYGIPKPPVTDWSEQPIEVYTNRCVEDVKINAALWKDLEIYLKKLYPKRKDRDRFIDYLMFKMDCLREQESTGWRLDLERAQKNWDETTKLRDEKKDELAKFMPDVPKFKVMKPPAKPFKKDGSLSVLGVRWRAALKKAGKKKKYQGELKVRTGYEKPNPGSHDQVKSWLFGLGWIPASYKFKKDDDGNERQIPQVRIKDSDNNSVLCPSVLLLSETHPEIEHLQGLSILIHRVSVFKGFVENCRDGRVVAGAGGLTNTLRFKHRAPIVNLPGVDKILGGEIRGCLMADEGHVLVGSDMVSLEDTTKRHYMMPHDPDYVKEMARDGFDPHLDLAVHSGEVTQKQVDHYVTQKKARKGFEKGTDLTTTRKGYKVVNYAATYGVQKLTLSRNGGFTIKKAQELLDGYWARNWALEVIAEECEILYVGRDMWLLNPVSGFYYSLRHMKDRFSTLNQGTGVYCFDMWIMKWRSVDPGLTGQMHDEIIKQIPDTKKARKKIEKLLKWAIGEVNKDLKLNVPLDVDIQFGGSYADIH